MKKQLITTAALALFAIGTFTACKKDNKKDEPKKPTCQLISATISSDTDPSSYTFSYNSDNKINQILYADKTSTITTSLTYTSTNINVVSNDGKKTTRKIILSINSAGRITRMEDRHPTADTIQSYTTYTYATNGDLTSYTYKSASQPSELTTVATTNGNITSLASGGNITSLEYFADQAWRAGDYVDILQRITVGNNYYWMNKNLIKSFSSGSDISNFSYTYDANNNISALKIIGGGGSTDITYQHQCQ